jgi:hypothetical protein
LESDDGVRNLKWKGERRRKAQKRSRERDAVVVDTIEGVDNMVAKAGWMGDRRRKTRDRGWEQTDGAKTKADPATRMDSVTKESGSSWSRLKGPRVETPGKSDVREGSAAVKVSRKVDQYNETGELKMGS